VQSRIVIISASVGAGHDGVASELRRRLLAAGFRVELLDFLDMLPGVLGRALRRGYALELAVAPSSWDLLYTALERHRSLAATAARLANLARRRVVSAVDHDCAAVVSTYPLASQVLGQLRRTGQLPVPVASFLCDMSIHPLWVSQGVDTHLAMHKVAADQAEALGAPGVVVTAPAVPPRFKPAPSRQEAISARLSFGLPLEGKLALVLAGSWGVGNVERTALDVAASGLAVPVVVCGQNAGLHRRLTRRGIGIPLGWVDNMPALLQAADLVVHNAGGLSCMEALAAELPVLTYRCIPGHGQTNVAALDLSGLAAHARSIPGLHQLLTAALSDELAAMQRSAAASLWAAPDPAEVIASLARRADIEPAPPPVTPGPRPHPDSPAGPAAMT
jgi:UDP-N-acetylglucosamine:LPS N-acetylglucosamine transferase